MRRRLLYLASMVLAVSAFVGLVQMQPVSAGGGGDGGDGDHHSVTPKAPSFVDPTCETNGSYYIPSQQHVTYKVSTHYWGPYETRASGTHQIATGQTIYIIAEVSHDYDIQHGVTSYWSHEFKLSKTCVQPAQVTFVDPTCEVANGSYTIPIKQGVIYKVNNVTVGAGSHSVAAGTSVTVTAVATSGYVLTGQTVWTHLFTAKEGCVEQKAVINYDVVCGADGATVTLTNTGNISGNATVNGEVISVAAGATVKRVINTGKDGAQITIVVGDKTVYDQLADCDKSAVLGASTVVATPTVLPKTSGDSTAAAATVISAAGAFVTILSFAVRRLLTRGV